MKKTMALILSLCLVSGIFAALTITASADLKSVTDTCTYTITTKNVGFPHYRDADGKKDLFDGVMPTKDILDAAAKNFEDPAHHEWYVWEGWTAIACTSADSFKKGSAVNIDFAFEEPVELSEVVVHTAAMKTGNVGIAAKYQIYVSDDNKTWTLVKDQATDSGFVENKYAFDDTAVKLDKPVKTKYMRLVADGLKCWWFCSEIEILQDEKGPVIDLSTAQSKPATSGKPETPSTSDNGIVALAVIASLALVGAVVIKKTR